MKKRERFKNFIKKTLFGEKLENALQKKSEIKKFPPIVEPKAHFPAANKTIANDKPPLENTPEVLPEVLDKSESNQINSAIKTSPNADNIAAFRDIMQTRFDENAKATIPSVRLGIDLGTSCSKVVWRKGEENVFPVCFGKNKLDLADYLMPSLIAFDGEKIATGFEALAFPQSAISNFKMCLACESKKDGECGIRKCSLTIWKPEFFTAELTGEETKFVNSLFLAKLLARTKQSIVDELTKNQGFSASVKPKWTANYAVPDTFIEQSEIAESFREVFRIAWFLAEIFIKEPHTDNQQTLVECYLAAQDLARESGEILNDEEFGCSPYPEIGAEVASIVMSKTSETGLYAFVDVGAGTVEASVFRYFRDGEKDSFSEAKAKRPICAASISRTTGAAQIEIRASKESGYPKEGFPASNLKVIKESYTNLSKNEKEEISEKVKCIETASEAVRTETIQYLKKVFRVAFDEEKDTEGKISKSEWESWYKLKLILGGGGANLDIYRNAATNGFTIAGKEPKKPNFVEILVSPKDFDMNGLPNENFLRFAVAYGLTYPIDKLPPPDFFKEDERIQKKKARPKKNADWYEK